MEKEFVPYEPSFELKKLGFDEPCIGAYFYLVKEKIGYPDVWKKNSTLHFGETACTAPLWQQTFDFFRKEFDLKGDVKHAESNGSYTYTIWKWNYDNTIGKWQRIGVVNSWNTYEEARLSCLLKLIDIVKSNQNGRNS